ncbi:hypothetical protein OG21DRAFT_1501201 [Imleria badia]|nr:hypothetical protein OG21DRAFT_1501201 [Imleria badia]
MPSLTMKRIFSRRSTLKTGVKANGAAPRVLPSFDELPKFHEFNGCAWEVWGKDDELGAINLLTEDVVQRAAREEIQWLWEDGLIELYFEINVVFHFTKPPPSAKNQTLLSKDNRAEKP